MFLVALCRQRWGLVAVMVVLAALIKPQFAVLAVVLFAARQWRLGGIAVAGVVISNLAAYLLWPRDFPEHHRAVDPQRPPPRLRRAKGVPGCGTCPSPRGSC